MLDKQQYSIYTEKGKRATDQPLSPQSHFSAVDCFYRVFFAEPYKIYIIIYFLYNFLTKLERMTVNHDVAGSSPAWGAKQFLTLTIEKGIESDICESLSLNDG